MAEVRPLRFERWRQGLCEPFPPYRPGKIYPEECGAEQLVGVSPQSFECEQRHRPRPRQAS